MQVTVQDTKPNTNSSKTKTGSLSCDQGTSLGKKIQCRGKVDRGSPNKLIVDFQDETTETLKLRMLCGFINYDLTFERYRYSLILWSLYTLRP